MQIIKASSIADTVRRYKGDLDRLSKDQVPFATAMALTWTAKKVQSNVKSVMKSRLDRPKPFTINALYVKAATKKNLVARVWFKDHLTKGIPADIYMRPAVLGGARRHKRSEKALIARGIMSPSQYMVPAAGAKLDAYGNMRNGQITRILSGLGAFTEQGYLANARRSKRSIRKGNSKRYFVGNPGGEGAGIWQRKKSAFGEGIQPVVLFVDAAPRYRVRVPFEKIAINTQRAHYAKNFEKALRQAIDMAKRFESR